MSEEFVVDKESPEYKKWVDYADRALRYGMTMSEEERLKPPTSVLEYVAHEHGVSANAMEMLAMYL